jgi:hypothetical protein
MVARVILLARCLWIVYSLFDTNLTISEFNNFYPFSDNLILLEDLGCQLITGALAAPLKHPTNFYGFRSNFLTTNLKNNKQKNKTKNNKKQQTKKYHRVG